MHAPPQGPCRFLKPFRSNGKVVAEYLWLGGSGTDLRSQARVLQHAPTDLAHLPDWHVDGSCSGLALADDFYVYLKPKAFYPDPFRGGDNVLVLCSTHTLKEGAVDLVPHPTNNRSPCQIVMDLAAGSEPTFSANQEYTITNPANSWIVSSSVGSVPVQGMPSYGGAGADVIAGREVSDMFLHACLHAGLRISGASSLQSRGQWVYSLGPCPGISLSDELWVSRYLLLRTAELHNLGVSFDPEPVPSNLQLLTCSIEYSTCETNDPADGLEHIHQHIEALKQNHIRHVVAYGKGYLQRLSVPCQDLLRQRSREFSSSIGSKLTSVMIPHATRLNNCGHYVDQRPASNMDPYLVTSLLVSTTLGIPLRAAAGVQEPRTGTGGGHGPNRVPGVEQVIDDVDLDEGDANAWEEAFINEIALHEPLVPDTPPLKGRFEEAASS